MGYVLVAGAVAGFGIWGTCRAWRAEDPTFKSSWRGRSLVVLLCVLGATALAFLFHVGSSEIGWTYLKRGPFDEFVGIVLQASLLPIAAAVIGRGALRVFPVIGALGVAWLWLLVAAYSFIM
jgi:hypothetical protein